MIVNNLKLLFPFANPRTMKKLLASRMRELTDFASLWFVTMVKQKESQGIKMIIRTTNNDEADGLINVDSLALLAKAQTGEIPLALLRKSNLDRKDIALFLARELLFLHSAAEGARMNSLALLFYELHTSLIHTATTTVRSEKSNKSLYTERDAKSGWPQAITRLKPLG